VKNVSAAGKFTNDRQGQPNGGAGMAETLKKRDWDYNQPPEPPDPCAAIRAERDAALRENERLMAIIATFDAQKLEWAKEKLKG
jgi:hypothetical protein